MPMKFLLKMEDFMADSLQKKSKKELTDKKRTESFKGVRFFFYKLGLYRKVFLEKWARVI
ncbi:hypothetical protein R51_22690 [Bacillus safensis]|nr:hypothetical protein R51_22690 [Bacillus safensis]